TTCLDEWQIGVLGVASGFVLFLTGSGPYSLDHYFMKRSYPFTAKKWFAFLGSGQLPIKNLPPKILFVSILIAGLTLFTNLYFHRVVFGKLNNKSLGWKVEIWHVQQQSTHLAFRLFRVEGADVYGSILIGIQVLDENNRVVKSIEQEELAQF